MGVATTYNDGVLDRWLAGSRMGRHSDAGKEGIVGLGRVDTQARGDAAESLAESFLAGHGLKTLERKLRCRGGEIDLICLDGATLVFVEVRLRAPGRFGSAADSITPAKRQRIILAARWWLTGAGRAHAGRMMRFDAVLFDRLDIAAVNWLRDAFVAEGS